MSDNVIASGLKLPLLVELASGMPLFTSKQADSPSVNDLPSLGWQLSPEPYTLTVQQSAFIQALGQLLLAFIKAQNTLYAASTKGQAPGWIADYLNLGKPEAVLQLARNKRFKSAIPLVIRPDLLVTEDGFALTEIDSVPGGIGFIAGLHHLYQQAGFSLMGHPEPLATAFADWLKAIPQPARGVQVIVVSDEGNDYWAEWQWLVSQLPPDTTVRLARPQNLSIEQEALYLQTTPDQPVEKVSLIYRFFELFDLSNLPKWPLIQYAIQKGWVTCTPPLRPHMEEKLWLALWHNPVLRPAWQQHLQPQTVSVLDKLIPQGWIMDPRPLPPGAAIVPELWDAQTQTPVQDLAALADWGQKARQLVLKPSGFSPLAWGSRGVTVGHDVPQAEWAGVVNTALQQFYQTPYILQRFHKPKAQSYLQYDQTGQIIQRQGRTRLCPYYLINGEDVTLLGVLATTVPADKKIVHGMTDAVLAPCQILKPA